MIPDVRTERLGERPAGLFAYLQHLRGRIRDQRFIPDRSQVDEPNAVRIPFQHVSGNLQCQAGLAEAAHAQQREQARPFEQTLGIGELALPSDERSKLLGQVVRRRLERTQRGKVLPQPRMHELIDVFARCKIA